MAEFEYFGIIMTYSSGAGYPVVTATPVVCDVTHSQRRFKGSWGFERSAATDPTTHCDTPKEALTVHQQTVNCSR